MTKKEVIKEAYGEYWEHYGHLTDENGFVPQSKLFYPTTKMFKIGIDVEVIGFEPKGEAKWRPKSLQGIENNNGWIKLKGTVNEIKAIYSLWIITKNGDIEYLKENEFMPIGYATHYQKAVKPLKPIY